MRHRCSSDFLAPVDAEALGLEDYAKVPPPPPSY
jgi:hypothetical protein